MQMKTTPGQHWPLLSCGHFLFNILIIAGITMKSTRAYYPWEGELHAHKNFSPFHTFRCTLWKNTAKVQTHTMCVILHSSERLSHPQSTRLHASATEPEKSCTYLVSSLEPFPSVCRLCTSEKADWWVERVCTVHTAHHPECTQAVPRLG